MPALGAASVKAHRRLDHTHIERDVGGDGFHHARIHRRVDGHHHHAAHDPRQQLHGRHLSSPERLVPGRLGGGATCFSNGAVRAGLGAPGKAGGTAAVGTVSVCARAASTPIVADNWDTVEPPQRIGRRPGGCGRWLYRPAHLMSAATIRTAPTRFPTRNRPPEPAVRAWRSARPRRAVRRRGRSWRRHLRLACARSPAGRKSICSLQFAIPEPSSAPGGRQPW